MIETIYFEEEIKSHPRTQKIFSKFQNIRKININRYGEIFNRRNQNFKIQKENPALIIAKKHSNFVLKAPENFGIGSNDNFYFSHMYNCIYDCKYCFLQGMYSSSNFVLFVNFEDFNKKIKEIIEKNPSKKLTFFSGYDCDSLALEKITGFAEQTIPFFKNYPNALLELRTKSNQIHPLDKIKPIDNCVIAYSLMPEKISKQIDLKAPSINRRILSIKKLADLGWKIGIRFDPLIHGKDWKSLYKELHDNVFKNIPLNSIHSISYGTLRFPKSMFKKIHRLHSDEKLFSGPFTFGQPEIGYKIEIEEEMIEFCKNISSKILPETIIFRCTTSI